MIQPQRVDADQELLNKVIQSIVNLRAQKEIPRAGKKRQSRPSIVISVTDKKENKKNVKFYPIAGSKKYGAESSDLSWSGEVGRPKLENVSRTFPEYRERRVMRGGGAITYVKLSFIPTKGKKESHMLEQVNPNAWQEVSKNKENIRRFSSKKFQEFMSTFFEKNVESFISSQSKLGKIWKNNPDIEVDFLDKEKKIIKSLQIRTDYQKITIIDGERKKELRKMNEKFTQAMPSSIVNFWESDQKKVEEALQEINKAKNKAKDKVKR